MADSLTHSELHIEIDEDNNNKFTYFTKNGELEYYGGVGRQINLIEYIKLVREAGNFTPLKKIIISGKNNGDYIKTLIKDAQNFGKENGISIVLAITNEEVIA